MTTPYDCALDGVSLSGLDARICILDLREEAPLMRASPFPLPAEGQLLTQVRESLTIRVLFAIHEEDPVERCAALQRVLAWAHPGGVLTTSDRPGQQLTVACTALPAASAETWTETLALAFTTTRCPCWEDAAQTILTGSGAMTLALPGTLGYAPVSAVITNAGDEAVTRLSVQCGATWLIFEDIALPAGGKCYLQMADGLLSAAIDGESILPNRTSGSADCLLAPCGQSCTVCASASQPLEATFTARGRYA